MVDTVQGHPEASLDTGEFSAQHTSRRSGQQQGQAPFTSGDLRSVPSCRSELARQREDIEVVIDLPCRQATQPQATQSLLRRGTAAGRGTAGPAPAPPRPASRSASHSASRSVSRQASRSTPPATPTPLASIDIHGSLPSQTTRQKPTRGSSKARKGRRHNLRG